VRLAAHPGGPAWSRSAPRGETPGSNDEAPQADRSDPVQAHDEIQPAAVTQAGRWSERNDVGRDAPRASSAWPPEDRPGEDQPQSDQQRTDADQSRASRDASDADQARDTLDQPAESDAQQASAQTGADGAEDALQQG